MNGKLVAWEDARIHIGSHVIHYGTSVFEGIRCYKTPMGSRIFRLEDHIRRLEDSAKVYRMEIPYSRQELLDACVETIRANGFEECYLRPVVYRGMGGLGVNPLKNRVEVAIMTWAWGRYLGPEALEKGIDVCVSSWQRISPNSMPALAKTGGGYMNAQLIKMEAVLNGYTEGIALGVDGLVSEGSGENLFVVRDGILYTPPVASSILVGITRDTVLHLAKDLGLEVREQPIPRALLYIADEVFFTGTAAEITPIRSIDKIPVGSGRRGPITKRLQDRFFGILRGEVEDRYGWLYPVEAPDVVKDR
jgi:branched-chain amino acid aminotransferase